MVSSIKKNQTFENCLSEQKKTDISPKHTKRSRIETLRGSVFKLFVIFLLFSWANWYFRFIQLWWGSILIATYLVLVCLGSKVVYLVIKITLKNKLPNLKIIFFWKKLFRKSQKHWKHTPLIVSILLLISAYH